MRKIKAKDLTRCAMRLDSVDWISAIILLLGAVLVNVFFSYLSEGFFSSSVFATHIQSIMHVSLSPTWWKWFLGLLSNYSYVFAPLSGMLLLLLSVSLLLLIARGLCAFITGLFFLSVWISFWGVPGNWVFEYLFPGLFGIYAGLAKISDLWIHKHWKKRFFGEKFFKASFRVYWLLGIGLLSGIIAYAIYLSKDPNAYYITVAWQSGLSIGVLLTMLLWVDGFREGGDIKNDSRLNRIPWIDVMTMTIGAMLVMQIHADIALSWFTVEGYAHLIGSYEQSTSTHWIKPLLAWSVDHASSLMPLQFAFEASLAVLLSLVLLRAPVLFATGCFLAILMFSEFGVASTVSNLPSSPRTWTWELMFVTCSCFILGFGQLAVLLRSNGLKQAVFGLSVFGALRFGWSCLIAIGCAFLLWGMIYKAHVFGSFYLAIALHAGVSFFMLMIVLVVLDRFRRF